MNRPGTDPKVKKTLVRNCEKKITAKTRKEVLREVEERQSGLGSSSVSQQNNILSEPSLCSSAALANYLSDLKRTLPTPSSTDNLNINNGELCSKVTKKLNFHVNDKIYKNLIELNASIEETKGKKDRRPVSAIHCKKDIEPEIEDFCEDEKEYDTPPKINIMKSKFKPIKKTEDGSLHKLISSFEIL